MSAGTGEGWRGFTHSAVVTSYACKQEALACARKIKTARPHKLICQLSHTFVVLFLHSAVGGGGVGRVGVGEDNRNHDDVDVDARRRRLALALALALRALAAGAAAAFACSSFERSESERRSAKTRTIRTLEHQVKFDLRLFCSVRTIVH